MTHKIIDNWDLAKAAYQAYGDQVDWKNFQGNPMPTWDALPEPIKLAWLAAAIAVRQVIAPINPTRG